MWICSKGKDSSCPVTSFVPFVVIHGMAMAVSSYNLGHVVHIQMTAEVAASISLAAWTHRQSRAGVGDAIDIV